MLKTCSKCGIDKELSEFAKKGNGTQARCKECNRLNSKQHYLDNKDKYVVNRRKRRQTIHEWFTELKSTLKCERCGENHIACLDFHHQNPELKEYNIGWMIGFGMSQEAILAEIEKCIVLCANCHRKEHFIVP